MTKFAEITAAMHRYNNSVAYGSECNAWQDYVEDCYQATGRAPWAEWQDAEGEFSTVAEMDASDEFAAYWLAVATGESSDYVADSGARVEA